MKKLILLFLFVLFLIQKIVVLSGCATIVPPEGGPKDSLPPALLKAIPDNFSPHFTDKTITLSFDEYVDADNYQQELIVSPVAVRMPTVSRKLNTVTIKLRDSLEANTTYSLHFGNTLKDVNEGNIMKDFTYTFSTGSYFDSLELGGKVWLAETGEPDSLIIMLHRSDKDSAVVKERPRYVTKTDIRGNFRFKNLPPGTFYIYALKDEGGSYLYLNKTQLFAFLDSAVIVTPDAKPVTLYAYATKETETVTAKPSSSKKPTDKRLKFSTNIIDNKMRLLDKLVFTFETPLKNFDSSKVRFTRDSTYTSLTGYSWETDSTMKTVVLNYPWQEEVLHHIIVEKDFATDTLGRQLLKADTISFKTNQKKDYGKLMLRFRNLDLTKNPVLFFVQNKEVKYSFPLSSVSFTQTLFVPGEYSFRILNDANKNGLWDPGQFFGEHRQPELVKPLSRTINVKPNWENQFDIDVTAPPAKPATQPSQKPGLPRKN